MFALAAKVSSEILSRASGLQPGQSSGNLAMSAASMTPKFNALISVKESVKCWEQTKNQSRYMFELVFNELASRKVSGNQPGAIDQAASQNSCGVWWLANECGSLGTWGIWAVLTSEGSGTDPDGDIVVGSVQVVLDVC